MGHFRGNLPYFRKTFLRLNYTDVTKNIYIDSDVRKMWSLCSSVLEPVAKPRGAIWQCMCYVLGTLRMIFMKLV
jgi:hypothetical protein